MDPKISPTYESLIHQLLSLKSKYCSNIDPNFINDCIEQIEKMAIMRPHFKHLFLQEKEIEQLNITEAQFLENIYRIITYSEIIFNYKQSQSNSLSLFLAGVSCFLALTAILLVMSVLLITSLAPLAGILLICALAASLLILHMNASILNTSILNESPFLAYLETKIAVLIQTLKKVTLELDQTISLLESKINYQKYNNEKNEKFIPSYENRSSSRASLKLTPAPPFPTIFFKSNITAKQTVLDSSHSYINNTQPHSFK